MKEPILVSVPHGGWKIPEEIQHMWNLSKKQAFHDGDPYTSQIYDFSDKVNAQIVMEYYRAAIDLNREPDNMAPENPDGLIKSHTCYNEQVYKDGILPDENLKKILLDKYYYPYHKFLKDSAKRQDIKLGVDCHSMAAKSPPLGGNTDMKVRSLICLGNLGDKDGNMCPPHNRLSCATELILFVKDEFEKVFRSEDVEIEIPYRVGVNYPCEGVYFEGGYITRNMGYEDIPFFQIEMSRTLYLTDKYFDKENLIVKESRIKDLNNKVWKVLKNTIKNL